MRGSMTVTYIPLMAGSGAVILGENKSEVLVTTDTDLA